MFEGWVYCWFKDGSRGNKLKCLSKSNRKHSERKRGKGRKEFHNRTIWFQNKYISDVGVLTFSIIITGLFSTDVKMSPNSVIMVSFRIVFLCMSRLSPSTQRADIELTVPFNVGEAVAFVASHGFF